MSAKGLHHCVCINTFQRCVVEFLMLQVHLNSMYCRVRDEMVY